MRYNTKRIARVAQFGHALNCTDPLPLFAIYVQWRSFITWFSLTMGERAGNSVTANELAAHSERNDTMHTKASNQCSLSLLAK